MKPLSAQYMEMAARRVGEVDHEDNKNWKKQYGSLCHSFPVMVRQCGLAQAVAFSLAKADKPAHKRILDDLKDVFDVDAARVRTISVGEYMVATRRVLRGWIFFKRFAESILKVKSGDQEESET